MSASDQPVSLCHVRRAVVALGVVVLGFIWIMQQHHDQRVYNERLRTEGAEHLNLGVVAAQNIRQIAARARALGSIYRVEMQTEDRGSRDFPSKNDKVLWRPRRLWPPEGYYFFRDPYLGSV